MSGPLGLNGRRSVERSTRGRRKAHRSSMDIESTYARYGPMVLRRCRSLLRDEERALDALHDTFVRLLRSRERLHDDALSSLLWRMATNVCLNQLRTQRRHPEDARDDALAEIAELDVAEDQTLARRVLEGLFAREPADTRTMAVLYYVDGMTHAEVAREVGLSVSGVRKRLDRLKINARALAEMEVTHEA